MALEWTDDAIVLEARPHGETAAVAQLLTQEQGRFAGLVYGGQGRRARPLLQPGNRVRANWRARLADHLGAFTLEPLALRAGVLLDDAQRLTGVSAACALAIMVLPEREPHPRVHDGLELVLSTMAQTEHWPALLVRWEAGVLADLGYGMDLSRCALGGASDRLSHVSPASGRAVDSTHPDAGPFLDRLLRLPKFLMDPRATVSAQDMRDGLLLTGYFLERRVLWPADRTLPEARVRLAAMLGK